MTLNAHDVLPSALCARWPDVRSGSNPGKPSAETAAAPCARLGYKQAQQCEDRGARLGQAKSRCSSGKPGRDCPRCPRLVAFRKEWRAKEPAWFNAPVPSFGPLDARLLIVGLAPGTARRQPHRTAVHRRLCRRPALRDAEGIRLRPRRIPGAAGRQRSNWSTPASPTACAACRRRTSRRRRRSTPAGIFWRPPSRRCRTCAPSSRWGASRMRRRCGRSAASSRRPPFSHGGRAQIGPLALF